MTGELLSKLGLFQLLTLHARKPAEETGRWRRWLESIAKLDLGTKLITVSTLLRLSAGLGSGGRTAATVVRALRSEVLGNFANITVHG
jgi:hypothetical protein